MWPFKSAPDPDPSMSFAPSFNSHPLALGTYLLEVWKEGRKLWVEGDKLCVEGYNLCAESSKLYAEGRKLRAEGDKLWAEGRKLWAEGYTLCVESSKLFTDAVVEVYGKDIIEWTDYGCKVDNVEFRYD